MYTFDEKINQDANLDVLWHEFQHMIYHTFDRGDYKDEYSILAKKAYEMALDDELTDYAKEDDNEALSELFLIMHGRINSESETYNGIREKKLCEEYTNLINKVIYNKWIKYYNRY
jgi:hypothetical protein